MAPYCVLTFDCYGTLVDWVGGIRSALTQLVRAKNLSVDVEALHLAYSGHEKRLQQPPYRKYREVLRQGVEKTFAELGIKLSPSESDIFAHTLPSWPAFLDTTEVLTQLKQKGYKLVILSNIDDNLVQGSLKLIGVDFDGVITAEQVGSYKPSPNHWNAMLKQFAVSKGEVLHIAQSYYHDVVPAKGLGFTVAWINRQGERRAGAAVPDYEFPDLRPLLKLV